MRITYRNQHNKDYWFKRWADIPPDKPMNNTKVYPLKFSEMIIKDKNKKILEAGCGAGRILRYYHEKGYIIKGIDFIDIAIEKLKVIDSTLDVETADISNLKFEDESFDYVLAFGLYHNLEFNLKKSVSETYRILKYNNGMVCASFRADNIQTKIVDWLTSKKKKNSSINKQNKVFHKINLKKSEFIELFENEGFKVDFISPVENMPLLYKFSFFRSRSHKIFNENKARAEGYKLSFIGNVIQRFLMKYFPDQFCNIYILIARKK